MRKRLLIVLAIVLVMLIAFKFFGLTITGKDTIDALLLSIAFVTKEFEDDIDNYFVGKIKKWKNKKRGDKNE